MSQATREKIECPACGQVILTGFWVATVLELRRLCMCGKMVQINKDYSTEIVHDYIKHRARV